MEERREEVLARLDQIKTLLAEIREIWPSPNLEASLRFAEMYFRWAEFCVGGSDRFEFEVGAPSRETDVSNVKQM